MQILGKAHSEQETDQQRQDISIKISTIHELH